MQKQRFIRHFLHVSLIMLKLRKLQAGARNSDQRTCESCCRLRLQNIKTLNTFALAIRERGFRHVRDVTRKISSRLPSSIHFRQADPDALTLYSTASWRKTAALVVAGITAALPESGLRGVLIINNPKKAVAGNERNQICARARRSDCSPSN